MKKIYYSTALFFLVIAIAYVTLFIMKVCRGEPIKDILQVIMTGFSFFMAWFFWNIGKHCNGRVEKSTKTINETYQMLMDIYDNIKDSNRQDDELSIRLFVTGVYDFGCYVWDIVTDCTYPKAIRDDAEQKLDELMKCVAQFV